MPWTVYRGDPADTLVFELEGDSVAAYTGSWASLRARGQWVFRWDVECERGLVSLAPPGRLPRAVERDGMLTSFFGPARLLNRDVRLFMVTPALIGFSFFGAYGVLLNLWLLRLGYGTEFVGLVNAAGSLGLAAFSLPAGALAMRWGVRSMLMCGLALLATGHAITPLAEFLPHAWQVPGILAAHMLCWVGLAVYFSSNAPFLMAKTAPAARNHAFALMMALFSLLSFAGSLAGGALPGLFAGALRVSLGDPLPYRYTLLATAGLLLPGLLALAGTKPGPPAAPPTPDSPRDPVPVAVIAGMAAIMLFRVASEGAARTFFNVYLDAGLRVPVAQIGALASGGHLLAAAATLTASSMTVAVACSWFGVALGGGYLIPGIGYRGLFLLAAALTVCGALLFRTVVPMRPVRAPSVQETG